MKDIDIDGPILAQFERFAHWFQTWTGKDNFFLARICITVYGIISIWELYSLLQSGPWKWMYLQNYLFFAVAMYLAIKANLSRLTAEQLTTPKFRNPLQISFRFVRMVYLGAL